MFLQNPSKMHFYVVRKFPNHQIIAARTRDKKNMRNDDKKRILSGKPIGRIAGQKYIE